MGTQSTKFFNDMNDASMDDEEDMDEESEASPVKLVKGAGTKKNFIEAEEEVSEDERPEKMEKSPPAKKKKIEEPKVASIIFGLTSVFFQHLQLLMRTMKSRNPNKVFHVKIY